MRDALFRLLEPTIEALNVELVDIEFVQAGHGGILRIFIDTVPAQTVAGITVDDCARVSHAVSEMLEVEDPIKGHYTLEVSSPGIDRNLRKRAHFERFVGEQVLVELRLPMDGRRRFGGVLKSIVDGQIVVVIDGDDYVLPLDRIQKARLKAS